MPSQPRSSYQGDRGLGGKKSGEWAKSRKGYDRNRDRTRQKNKRGERDIYIYIEKWDQTGSPEIPDRGGDID